ncbi:hypothetical protein AO716_05290 [Arthrobacter sp. Edens01]|nr:hypothetical protein AO716_05290 [Arthrobacter sp. Edens01]
MQEYEVTEPVPGESLPEKLLTRVEVAAWLQISPKTLANWSSNGVGPRPLKLHGFVRYKRATVHAWIERAARDAA